MLGVQLFVLKLALICCSCVASDHSAVKKNLWEKAVRKGFTSLSWGPVLKSTHCPCPWPCYVTDMPKPGCFLHVFALVLILTLTHWHSWLDPQIFLVTMDLLGLLAYPGYCNQTCSASPAHRVWDATVWWRQCPNCLVPPCSAPHSSTLRERLMLLGPGMEINRNHC